MAENENELLEKLKENAKKDLKGAKFVDWGNSEEDVATVLLVKNSLETTLAQIDKQYTSIQNIINNNTQRINLCKRLLNSEDTILTDDDRKMLEEDIKNIEDLNTENKKRLQEFKDTLYDNKSKVIKESLKLFDYTIDKVDGKAYFKDDVILMCKIIRA